MRYCYGQCLIGTYSLYIFIGYELKLNHYNIFVEKILHIFHVYIKKNNIIKLKTKGIMLKVSEWE